MNDRTLNNYTEAQAKNRLLKEVNKPDNANLLTRLLAVPLSIGSVPDLIYHKDPLRYPKNIGKGVWTTLTGKDYTKNIKTGSDLLEQRNILQDDGIPENVANFLLSLGIDVATDPLAFTKPVKALRLKDATKVVKNVGLKGTKAKKLARLLTKEDVGNIGRILKKMGVGDAKEYGEKLAEEVSKKKATRKVVVGGFGKSKVLSESENANTALDLLFNPVGTAIKGGAKVVQTVAPESTEKAIGKFNDLFVLGGNAKRKGLGKAAKRVKQNVQSSYEDKEALLSRKMINDLDLNNPDDLAKARGMELALEMTKTPRSKKKKAVENMVEDLLKKSGREDINKAELKELLTDALKEKEGLDELRTVEINKVEKPLEELTDQEIKGLVRDTQLKRVLERLGSMGIDSAEEKNLFGKVKKPEFKIIPKAEQTEAAKKFWRNLPVDGEWVEKSRDFSTRELEEMLSVRKLKGPDKFVISDERMPFIKKYIEELTKKGKVKINPEDLKKPTPDLLGVSPIENAADWAGKLPPELSDLVEPRPGASIFTKKAGDLLEKYGVGPRDFFSGSSEEEIRTLKDALATIKGRGAINGKTMKAAKAGDTDSTLSILKALQPDLQKIYYKYKNKVKEPDQLWANLYVTALERVDKYNIEKYKYPTLKSFMRFSKGEFQKAVNKTVTQGRSLPKGLLDDEQKLNRALRTVIPNRTFEALGFTNMGGKEVASKIPGIKSLDLDDLTPKQWKALEGLGFSRKRVEDIKQGMKSSLNLDDSFMTKGGRPVDVDETLEQLIDETEKVDPEAAKVIDGIQKILKGPDPKSPIGFEGLEELQRKYARDVSKIDFARVGDTAEKTLEYQTKAKEQLYAKAIHAKREVNALELENIIKDFRYDDGRKAFSTKQRKGWVYVPHLEGYVPKEGAKMLKQFYDSFNPKAESNDFIRFIDGMNNRWKKIVTSYSPWFMGYSVRNAIGDSMNMMLGGYGDGNPVKMINGFKQGMEFMGMLRYISKNGLASAEKKYSKHQIRAFHEAFDRGVFSGKFNQVAEDISYKVKGELLNPKEDIWKKTGVAAMEWRENMFRMSNFLDAYRRTNSWEEAANLAKRTSLDFSNLTEFERKTMKRIVPFYGFLRANLEHQLHVYENNPFALIFQERVFDNVKNLFAGKKLTEEEWDNIPDWMKNGLAVPISKDENGTYRMMTNFGEPTQVYNNLIDLSSPRAFVSSAISGVNPLIKFPLEMIYNYSTFRDDKVSNLVRGSYYKNFPKPVKDLLEYSSGTITDKYGRKVSSTVVNPERAYVMSNAPFISPFVVQAKNLLDYKDQGNDALLNLSGILGGKIRKRNTFADRRGADKDVEDLIQQLISQ